ncbi:hypothetical protein SAMN05216353_10467 [Halobacillus alkaliphilus]|uniref:Uncharacterized protein n=1 Tax=Halobacillus alkaliphilus TaxID=396056 RepID=A0A1I2KCK3_9BACI|nr:hypothetical protein SAMN05216353_10467 [Halobacillus alkaliphilus]
MATPQMKTPLFNIALINDVIKCLKGKDVIEIHIA